MTTKVPKLGTQQKASRGESPRPATPEQVKDRTSDPAEAGHTIGGLPASDIEWATYRGLRALGYDASDIAFQQHFMGGRRLPGGQVLDFVVQQNRTTVVIDVRGEHWHGDAAGKGPRDDWKEMMISARMGGPTRTVVIWEREAHSWTTLLRKLSAEVGVKV
jgi:hypothetical protein